MGCPYEGEISIKSVENVTKRLLEIGCYEVLLLKKGSSDGRKFQYSFR